MDERGNAKYYDRAQRSCLPVGSLAAVHPAFSIELRRLPPDSAGRAHLAKLYRASARP